MPSLQAWPEVSPPSLPEYLHSQPLKGKKRYKIRTPIRQHHLNSPLLTSPLNWGIHDILFSDYPNLYHSAPHLDLTTWTPQF